MTATTSTRTRVQSGLLTLLIAYYGFILLGLPDGMLGVAWPSMQQTFNVTKEAFGLLLLPGTIGYMLVSTLTGRAVGRYGMAVFLALGVALRLAGLLGFAMVPVWGLLLSANFVAGLGAGGIDSGYNTYVASNYSAGRMNWLHACFGLGATLGPLLVNVVLNTGQSWQAAYLIAAGLQSTLLILVLAVWSHWRMPAIHAAEADPAAPRRTSTPARSTLRIPAVWLGILTFALYTGTELTVGNWSYSIFTEARGTSADTAALWTSIFWASLTLGRIIGGVIVDRVGAARILRWSMIGTVIGAVMLSVQSVQAISFLGLALLGLALAAIFPTLIALTPGRFGLAHGPNAIGFQIAAAGLGVAILPGLAGVLAGRVGLEALGPYIVILGVLMWAVYEIGMRMAPAGAALSAE